MDLLKNYHNGINLGGWISQYQRYLIYENHLKTFITEDDIRRIAEWGFDHVRLPFDYDILEDDENPYVYKEEGFSYIDRCLQWCEKYQLSMVLDFHRGPGQNFYPVNIPNPLFTEEENRKRFVALWKAIAKRYLNVRDRLAFEVLNEAVEPAGYRWNKFYQSVIESIREIDSTRKIIVGGIDYNSASALRELEIVEDPYIIYNFHFYEPFQFTHQHAGWCEDVIPYGKDIYYPGEFTDLKKFLDEKPQFSRRFGKYVWAENNKELMLTELQDALNFIQYTGKPLYCGEYGMIDGAPEQSKLNYLTDLTEILNSHGIARAYWNYKECDFGIVDRAGNVNHREIINVISKSF